jgi:hypothetical protein
MWRGNRLPADPPERIDHVRGAAHQDSEDR